MVFSYRETQIVKGMLARGDKQHDIAAYFGVNGGRVAEVANGKCNYPSAVAVDEHLLPPPGPYTTRHAIESVVSTLRDAIGALGLAAEASSVDDLQTSIALAQETLEEKIKTLEES